MTDAVGDLRATLETRKAVAGAGACEIALARRVREYAASFSGRERLAIDCFADSLEVIPRTLAENAGLDPIDVVADLKAAHVKSEHAGIDVFSGKVMDAWAQGVIEPLRIKTQAVASATDVATMILRIDDVIASGRDTPQGEPEMD
jgi:chaperonin GroEL (HSP60 family)